MKISLYFLVITTVAIFASFQIARAKVLDREPSEPTRQLIRGRSSVSLENKDEAYDVTNERDLRRTRHNGGGNGRSKGSKSGGESKGSKGGSSSSFSGGFDDDKGTCGAFCGEKDFAYIHLDGSYFFGEFNDNSTDTVPIETTVGGLSSAKEGSTLRIFEDDLRGSAKYFDHYDKYPYKRDISGVVTGSCTVLGTFPGNSSGAQFSEDCLAHCTICVSYTGLCCDSHGYGWDKEENCTTFGGFATVTGDLLFEVEQRIGANGRLQSIPLTEGGLVGLDGFGAITGTAGELGPASNGGLGIIEYDAFSSDGDTYSIGLKVPFNNRASCKLQETVLGGLSPPESRPSPPTPPPSDSKGDDEERNACGNTKTFSISSFAEYDKLVLPPIPKSMVSWDVAYASKETKIELVVPYEGSAAELAAIDAVMASIESLELDPAVLVENVLALPQELESLMGDCVPTVGSIHITIPRYSREFCIGSSCRPVLCPVGPLSSMSYVPGNSEMFFGQSTSCELVFPTAWDAFLQSQYGGPVDPSLASPEAMLYLDLDGDGASNILEYYGLLPLIALYADGPELNTGTGVPVSTNSLDPDTDGDLFVDSYELLYGLDPFTSNSVTDDTDGDGLSDFLEQIYGTNPLEADSDGDGVDDATEILVDSTDPLDDSDFIEFTPTEILQATTEECEDEKKTIDLSLTIGDHSGSASERYIMNVGGVQHQSTQFGQLLTSVYPFKKGTYKITVEHRDSNLENPDYDYTAAINWDTSNPDFEVTIDDPQGLLGVRNGNDVDLAAGKTATMKIKLLTSDCNYDTCAECRADSQCLWDVNSKVCSLDCRPTRVRGRPRFNYSPPPESCPCEKCKEWARKEREERMQMDWVDNLPRCPCFTSISSLLGIEWLSVQVPEAGVDWDVDWNCNPNVDCSNAHPGASGCLRANAFSGPYGQQCCYRNVGGVGQHIPTGEGAGTPDKEAGGLFNWYDHMVQDYWTYKNCCPDCEIADVCLEYIGGTDSNGNEILGARQDTRDCI